jgi:replicative DNA helicase
MEKQNLQQKNMNNSVDMLNLPHNEEAERATIGGMLLEKTAVYEVMDFLKPEMFYSEFLSEVYKVILSVEDHSEVDLITVSEAMRKNKKEFDMMDLVNLSEEVMSATHIQIHARIVYQDYLRRKFMLNCAKSLTESNDMSIDVSDLIDNHIYEIENLSNISDTGITESIGKVAVEAYNNYKDRAEKAKQGESVGIHTGLRKLDNVLHGFQKGAVYILAARPGMGKSAFMINIARRTAMKGNNVLIFSLEMTQQSLIDRMVIADSGINSEDYKAGRLTQEEYISMAESFDKLSLLPISINDTASISIQQIRSQAKKFKRQGKCDLIMIDYLQLIDMEQIKGKSTNDEVAAVSRAVKIMAKDLDVPIVLLSQLNRSVENRVDKKPILADLRDSGAIEQDADAVLFIHRDSYYSDTADRNSGFIRVAKNREGRTGDISFWVDNYITNFLDEAPKSPQCVIGDKYF